MYIYPSCLHIRWWEIYVCYFPASLVQRDNARVSTDESVYTIVDTMRWIGGWNHEEVVSFLICSFLDGSWSHMKCLLNSPLYRCRQKFHENLNHCDFETVYWLDYHNHGTIRNCQKKSFASFSFYFCVNIPGEYLSYLWNSCMELKQMESSTPLVSNCLGKVCSSK